MEKELNQLKRQVSWLRYYAVASSLIMVTIMLTAVSSSSNKDIIRAKGIIIEDSAGRDRILIGTPIPESRHRMRTNLERVRKEWAPDLGGDKYMEHYATYEHDANGIVFLNEQGFDKIVLGEKTPDPNTGKRLVDAAGFTFNDDEGFERGGLGISKTTEGKYRVVFGMDDETGEAMHLFVLEDGTKGIQVASDDGRLILGKAKAGSAFFGNKEDFAGIAVMDSSGKTIWEKNALKK
ncbi:hypothetical protein [uncultured Pontibacter sp.]|uniref:hypothetical protein n=1 Tax=uncultured Pontibacter sp. TaxID=453356 RepID=UPI00262579C6|nr:hypothetical protein [uncultured Pontibacter sp.]